MNILIFTITTLGVGVLCSIPGILVGRFLATKGVIKDQSMLVVVGSICGVLFTRLLVPDVPLVYIAIFFLFLSPLGVYRHDLWTTFRSGKWWWSHKSGENPPLFNLPVSVLLSIGIGGAILILVFGIWVLVTSLFH